MKTLKKILIVEDEFPIALDLKRRIESMGHEVVGIAPNYDKGLLAFNQFNPDVVLLDINLNNDKDGIDLGVKFKSIAKHVIIVFVTSYSSNSIFEKAINSVDPKAYLVKPIRDNELFRTIEMALKSSKENTQMPEYIEQLSKREYEILKFVAMGFTDNEIGSKTHISINTVRTHLRRVYAKLLVKNKVEAVNFLNAYQQQNHHL